MVNYKRMIQKNRNRRLTEDDDIEDIALSDRIYDIVNDLEAVLDEFDSVIGLERLKAIHLNDSKNPFESHKDRHEKIGEGSIGLEAVNRIINNERLRDLPFYLETPNELPGYENEIKTLKAMRGEQ